MRSGVLTPGLIFKYTNYHYDCPRQVVGASLTNKGFTCMIAVGVTTVVLINVDPMVLRDIAKWIVE